MPHEWRPYSHIPHKLIDLEIAYEEMPGWNLIEAFAQAAGVEVLDHKLEMYPSRADSIWAERIIRPTTRKIVVIAAGPGAWLGRNWPEVRWIEVLNHLHKKHDIVLVGDRSNRAYRRLPYTHDLRSKTTMMQLATIIRGADVFAGIDSFPAHVAGAMDTARVVLFGITSAANILCHAKKTIAIESDPAHQFTGARHCHVRISAVKLGRPPQNPMDTIEPGKVLDAIESFL